MAGKTQAGMFLCNDCRDKFSARVGSVMERSHIPVHKWLLAMHLMAASKKGMSSKQLQRMLDVSYKSAWFLDAHPRGHVTQRQRWADRRPWQDGRKRRDICRRQSVRQVKRFPSALLRLIE